MKFKYSILLILLFCTGVVFAQEPKFTASVDKSEVGTGDRFEVTFSVNGNAERFTPPTLAGFEIVGGPNQSSSMQIINGSTSMSIAFSYVLMPTKEGDFVIGPASIVVNGKRLTTNPIKIHVVKGRAPAQNTVSNDLAAEGS